MNIFDVLYARNTGRIRPRAKITDNLLGLALAGGGTEEKTIDFTPIISVSDAKAGNALDYQCKITAKQTGTNPSPQNICPIDGWAGAQITRCGVNIWDEEWESGYLSNGNPAPNDTRIRSKNFIPVKPNVRYYCYAGGENNLELYIVYYRADKSYNVTRLTRNTSFTTPADCYYVKLYVVNNPTYNNNISINYPSTDTAYHAYNGTVYTVSWQTEAGIVYGGVRNLTTGTLTVTHTAEVFDDNDSWELVNNRFRVNRVPVNAYAQFPNRPAYVVSMANWLKYRAVSASSSLNDGECVWFATTNNLFVRVDSITSKADFETFIHDNPLVLIAELAEPITYTLTPTEITLAEGANTIWSDTGDSKLTYLAKK